MNVQYLMPKTIDMSPLLGHSEAHQIIKDVAQRIKKASEENSKNLIEAIKADELHDKKLDDEIKQLTQELEAKQVEYDNVTKAAAEHMLELNAAKEQHTNDKEVIKKLGDAAAASTKAVKTLEDDIKACDIKFKNLLTEKENISKKLKNQIESGKQCNEGRSKDKKEAAEALEAANKKTDVQKGLKEQFKEEIAVKQKECAKESQQASKELLEKNFAIDKLADDVKRESVAVLAANAASKTLENALNDKAGALADAENKIQRLEGEIKKLREAPPAPANSSGIPDGTYKVKVCRPMGKKKICGAEEDLEVKNGRLAKPLTGAKPGDDLLKVEKTKKGYRAIAPRLKFNPTIKF